MKGLEEYPLPIANLIRRVHNAKSPKERHDTAFFAWEASVRLAVAASPPEDVGPLSRPSTGAWVNALTGGPDILDSPALLDIVSLFTEIGQGQRSTPSRTTAEKLLRPLPAYRNRVIGHGSTRPNDFYDRAARTLLAGLTDAWRAGVFFRSDERVVFVEEVSLDAGGGRRARILDLTGTAGLVIDPEGTADIPDTLVPLRTYLRSGRGYTCLHPWILYRQTDVGEQVLFFDGLAGKWPRYLDYVSGEGVRKDALERTFADLPQRVSDLFGSREADPPAGSGPNDPDRVGDYTLIGKLGQGGMGIVHLARQGGLGRLVALKTLPEHLAEDPMAVARFRREIAVLSRSDHPNIVKILAAGNADGTHYYAMEYIEGTDLAHLARFISTSEDFDSAVATASEHARRQRIQQFGELPDLAPSGLPPEALKGGRRRRFRRLAALFRDAARALHHLHESGVIHRDVKPGNLMVTEADHRLVVMDLGLAKVADATTSLTRDKQSILGTLRYMPPEQLQRSLVDLDRRADVYSLGATFYELLTEQPLFSGDHEGRLIQQILREEPVRPDRVNPSLPRDLATILRKTTEKDPKLRYDTAEALAGDLDAFLQGRPIAARPPTLGYLLLLAVRRRKALAATITAAVLMLAILTGVYLVHVGRSNRELNSLNRQLLGTNSLLSDTNAEVARKNEALDDAYRGQKDALARATQSLVDLYRERGRLELMARRPERAAVYLAEAFSQGGEDPALELMLAASLRPLDRAGPVLRGHAGAVRLLDSSEHSSFLASGGSDGTVKLWNPADGRLIESLDGHLADVTGLAFGPDGSRLASCSVDHKVIVWNPRDGTALGTLSRHHEEVTALGWNPKGDILATASSDRKVYLWRVPGDSITAVRPLLGHDDAVWSLAWSPDGRFLATASSDGTVGLWDGSDGRRLATLRHGSPLSRVAWSPDGSHIAAGGDHGRARVWMRESGEQEAILEGHTGSLTALEFGPRGDRVLTASTDGTLRIWDAGTGEVSAVLTGHDGWVNAAHFREDGLRVISAGQDGTARVWDARSGSLLEVMGGHDGPVLEAIYSDGGSRIASSGEDGTVRIWDSACTALQHTLRHEGNVADVDVSCGDSQRVITASHDGSAQLWDLASGRPVRKLPYAEGWVTGARFSPDGRTAVTIGGRIAHLWDSTTGDHLADLDAHTDRISAVAFNGDGARLVTVGRDRSFVVWDSSGHEIIRSQGLTAEDPRFISFGSDGKLILTRGGQFVQVWDSGNGLRLREFRHGLSGVVDPREESAHAVTCAVFAPTGSVAATAGVDGFVKLFDVVSGRELHRLSGHDGAIWSLAFSPDGTSLVSAGQDGNVCIWKVENGELISRLEGHYGGVDSAAWNFDGALLATGGKDGTVRVWDPRTGRPLLLLHGHGGEITRVVWTPDGGGLLSSSRDGTASIWDVHRENRGRPQIRELVRRGRWWLEEGSLLPSDPLAQEVAGEIDRGRMLLLGGEAASALVLLNLADGKERQDTVRRFLLARAMPRFAQRIATLRGHESYVEHAEFSPDGRTVVTASGDHTARLWNADSGELLAVLHHGEQVWSADFREDGKRLVTPCRDGKVRIWDTRTGELLRVLEGHTERVRRARFSPDGRLVASAGADATLRIWNAETGDPIYKLQHDHYVLEFSFISDGSRVVTACEGGESRVWDVQQGSLLSSLPGHEGDVMTAAFNAAGTVIVTSSTDGSARTFLATDGSPLARFEHGCALIDAVWDPAGRRIVTSGEDASPRLWDAETGDLLRTFLQGGGIGSSAACFSPDGALLLTTCRDGTARLWDMSTGTIRLAFAGHEPRCHLQGVFSRDGAKIVTRSKDGTAAVWRATNGGILDLAVKLPGPVFDATLVRDGTRLVVAEDPGHIRVLDAVSGEILSEVDAEGKPTALAADSSGARVLVGREDGSAVLLDAEHGTVMQELTGRTGTVTWAAFAPGGGKIFIADNEGKLEVRDSASGTRTLTMEGHTGAVRCGALDPSGRRLATAGDDGSVRIHYLSGSVPTRIIPAAHVDRVCALSWSKDGRRLASASWDRSAKVWNPESGERISLLYGHEAELTGVEFLDDDNRILTTSRDFTARVWNLREGQSILEYRGHTGGISSGALDATGLLLATAGRDRTARIWEASTARLLHVSKTGGSPPIRVFWSPDGKRLVVVCRDGSTLLLDMSSKVPSRDEVDRLIDRLPVLRERREELKVSGAPRTPR